MEIQKAFEIRTSKFEQTYGYAALFEVYLIGIMNFLVDVGFITQDDLSNRLMREMDRFEEGITRMQEAKKAQEKVQEEFSTTAPKESLQSFSDFLKKEKIE